MASQQPYHAYAQTKGTLVPGQSIAVNKYTVEVERYLSQGGFAHVYLVRTPTPVYNTTHHVLKRIAVANEGMLSEVKKEVDIMRLLKGHPNIVHLIDAAWHKMPNGVYEVFILMEYCPGGGIIDMMNRRLRERLTEAEILQIFVDVCEGVAFMHNARPPLLHRDLKVENILQSSPTSFKLCDFGSATTVSRPPTNIQEIRAVEADLNRHTTLQYRAPEMVDVYSKRPIDEKSDVWALGVLLYKLCYYTTPFEEHGPLAILNVQYRIPPYPVYSAQMNMLIASMLREHGAQRPTVFELLSNVHRLRGTTSQFQYNIPPPASLSPNLDRQFKSYPSSNALEGTITYASRPQAVLSPKSNITSPSSSQSPTNYGVQAREKVLEAIAPMRRGRPAVSKEGHSLSRPSSPQKPATSRPPSVMDANFAAEEDRAWQTALGANSDKEKSDKRVESAWDVSNGDNIRSAGHGKPQIGFGDDFGEKLWKSTDPNEGKHLKPNPTPNAPSFSISRSPVLPARPGNARQESSRASKEKDAFEGLGLAASTGKLAPTLGEVRKFRTGLAITSTNINNSGINRYDGDKLAPSSATPGVRSSPSPRLPYSSPLLSQPISLSPVPLNDTSNGGSSLRTIPPATSSARSDGSAESRFPSLEELDAKFPSSSYKPGQYINKPISLEPEKSRILQRENNVGGSSTGNLLRPTPQPRSSYAHDDGTRSAQVTGVAMRQSRAENVRKANRFEGDFRSHESAEAGHDDKRNTDGSNLNSNDDRPALRPTLSRKHRSSLSIKQDANDNTSTWASSSKYSPAPRTTDLPPDTQKNSPLLEWRSWHDENLPSAKSVSNPDSTATDMAVLRESPGKRASFIEQTDFPIQEAGVALHDHTFAGMELSSSPGISPTLSKFTRTFPPIDVNNAKENVTLSDNWSPIAATRELPKRSETELSSSGEDEEPEEPNARVSAASKTAGNIRPQRKGRQSSVHDLVDLWGGGVTAKEKESFARDNVPKKPPPLREQPVVKLGSAPSQKSAPRQFPSGVKSPPDDASLSSEYLRHDKPRSSAAPSLPGRSRPQSMFIFPSKSVDSTSPASGLSPPEEPKPRNNLRRTSISDMVHRYEAIGGKPIKVSGAGPGPPLKQTDSKVLQSLKDSVHSTKQDPESSATASAVSPTKASFSGISGTRNFANGTPRKTFDDSRIPQRTTGNNLGLGPSVSQNDTEKSRRRSPLQRNSVDMTSRNANGTSSPSEEGLSSSPERPYQGVGKLIDQWQRKTAAAEPPKEVVIKRGNVMTKRPPFGYAAGK